VEKAKVNRGQLLYRGYITLLPLYSWENRDSFGFVSWEGGHDRDRQAIS
jgi:hypothetical protein